MKLGKNQEGILRALVEHGSWSSAGRWGCGWIWTNRSTTVRLLQSLVKKGLVDQEGAECGYKSTFTPTALAIQWVKQNEEASK